MLSEDDLYFHEAEVQFCNNRCSVERFWSRSPGCGGGCVSNRRGNDEPPAKDSFWGKQVALATDCF